MTTARATEDLGDAIGRGAAATLLLAGLLGVSALPASAQSVQVQVGTDDSVAVVPGDSLAVPLRVTVGEDAPAFSRLRVSVHWDTARLDLGSALGHRELFGDVATPGDDRGRGRYIVDWRAPRDSSASFGLLELTFDTDSATARTAIGTAVTVIRDSSRTSLLDRASGGNLSVCVGTRGRFGDVTSDGEVNSIDAQQIARFAVGLPVRDADTAIAFGDVTDDGGVNIIDAQQVARFAAGLQASERTGKWVPGGCESSLEPPSATISEPEDGGVFLPDDTVSLEGSGTDDDDGALTASSLRWSTSNRDYLEDVGLGEGRSVSSVDLQPGLHTLTLTAVDSDGAVATDRVRIEMIGNEAPRVSIESPRDGASFPRNDTVTFRGTASDPEEGELTGESLVWSSDLDGRLGTGQQVERSDLTIGAHEITLTATDSLGASDSKTITVTIDEPSLQITTDSLPTAVEDSSYRAELTAEHDAPPLTWELSGTSSLPDGLKLSDDGVISGTPTSDDETITVFVSDSLGSRDGEELTLRVDLLPEARIVAPADSTRFALEDTVVLEGEAIDDPETEMTRFEWFTSDGGTDTSLGTGRTLAVPDLPVGTHDIWLEVEAENGRTATSEPITVEIVEVNEPGYQIQIEYASEVTDSERSAVRQAVDRWEAAITGDLPALADGVSDCFGDLQSDEPIDDLLVFVEVTEVPFGVADGGPCVIREGSGLPAAGRVRFSPGSLAGNVDLAAHEIGHALGFLGDSELVERGRHRYNHAFTGPGAVAAFDSVGGADYPAPKVPIAPNSTAHWDPEILGSETMTSGSSSETSRAVISAVTIRSLEDIGYEVDVTAADDYVLPTETVELSPTADAALSSAAPDTNFGLPDGDLLSETLVVGVNEGNWTDRPADEELRSLLRFDPAPIWQDASLFSRALLFLRVRDLHPDDQAREIVIASPDTAWREDAVTWNTEPELMTGNRERFELGSCRDPCIVSGLSSPVRTQFLTIMDPNISSIEEIGFLMFAPSASDSPDFSVGYYTRHATEDQRPWMRVTYLRDDTQAVEWQRRDAAGIDGDNQFRDVVLPPRWVVDEEGNMRPIRSTREFHPFRTPQR